MLTGRLEGERELVAENSEIQSGGGGSYLRVEQEAAGSGHWGRRGGACDGHGHRLVNKAVSLPLSFLTTAHRCPLGATWTSPLVVRFCCRPKSDVILGGNPN